jgi:hypothetical protein
MWFPHNTADEATAKDDAPWETALLVASHVGFPIVAALVMVVHEDLYLGAHTLAVFVFSSVYHLCRGDWLCFGLSLEHARLLDHITALSAVVAVLLTVLYIHPTQGVPARVFMPFVVAFAVLAYPFQTAAVVLIGATVAVLIADRYLRQGAAAVPATERFSAAPLALAGAVGVLAYVLFLIDVGNYAGPHSAWHVLVSFAVYLAAVGVHRRRGQRTPWCCRGEADTAAAGE